MGLRSTGTMDLAERGGFRAAARALKPWQIRNLDRCIAEHFAGHGLICADDMGFGKTTTAIVACCAMRAFSKRKLCVACVPDITIENFITEAAELTTWETVLNWRTVPKWERMVQTLEDVDMVVIGHSDLSWLFKHIFEPAVRRRPTPSCADDVYATWQLRVRNRTHPIFSAESAAFVLDESHIFRNPRSQLFSAAMFAARSSSFPLALSGTPHQNGIRDFVSQLLLARGRKEFLEKRAVGKVVQTKLLERLRATSLIRAEESLDLPPLKRDVLLLEMPAQEAKAIEGILSECVSAMEKFVEGKASYFTVMVQFMKIRKVSVSLELLGGEEHEEPKTEESEEEEDSGSDSESASSYSSGDEWSPAGESVTTELTARLALRPSEKLRKCAEKVQEFIAQGRKTVVFCSFVSPLLALQEMVGEGQMLYGGQNLAQKDEAVRRFKEEDNTRVLFASVQCGGVGLNLQEASAAVIVDLWWNPFVTEQAVRRIWRLGQENPCDVVFVQYANSFDDAVMDLYHSWKLENARALLSSEHTAEVVQLGAREAVTLVEHVAQKRGLADLARRAKELSSRVRSNASKGKKRSKGGEAAIVAALSAPKKRQRKQRADKN